MDETRCLSECGGGGSGSSSDEYVIFVSPTDIVLDSAVEYICPGAIAGFNSESVRQYVFPHDATVKAVVMDISVNSNTNNTIFTLRKNSTDTSSTLTIAGGSGAGVYTVTNDVDYDKNDLLSLEFDNLLNTATFTVRSIAIVVRKR